AGDEVGRADELEGRRVDQRRVGEAEEQRARQRPGGHQRQDEQRRKQEQPRGARLAPVRRQRHRYHLARWRMRCRDLRSLAMPSAASTWPASTACTACQMAAETWL